MISKDKKAIKATIYIQKFHFYKKYICTHVDEQKILEEYISKY